MIASERILVDSSGWLEYLTGSPKKPLFEKYLASANKVLVVSTIVLYEVRKVLLLKNFKTAADWFASEALRHTIVPVDERLAFDAAANSIQFRLAMADALIYTTAIAENARLVTSDAHFNNIPNVLVL